MDIHENEAYKLLVKAIISVKDEKECIDFLDDVMTIKEVQDVSQRLLVAKMLSKNEVYNEISEKTGASTATISRVNRCYNYGSGGYTNILKKIEK